MESNKQVKVDLFEITNEPKGNTIVDHLHASAAEFVGTFLFLYMAFATAQASLYFNQGSLEAHVILTISAGFGLSIIAGILVASKISGAHLNPAVSIAFLFSGKLSFVRCILYIIAQLCASTTAAALVALNSPNDTLLVYNAVNSTVGIGSAVANEIILTFVLMSVIHTTSLNTKMDKGFGPLFIGLTIFAIHLAGIAISSTSVNPARSFGPAIISGRYENHWVFWAGPIVGSLISSVYFWDVKTL
jgi:MIP family channel proteins